MLRMKAQCERCQAKTDLLDVAYICSYECTFCQVCADTLVQTCPNCQGELLRRPTRRKGLVAVAVDQAKRKLLGN